MLETIARERVFASVTRAEELVDLYVRSELLTGAIGDARPEVQMMRALANDPPPRFVQVIGPAGAGKTSMILRVLADLGRREAATLHRPHEVLVVNVGDDPARLGSAASFMHTMVQLVAVRATGSPASTPRSSSRRPPMSAPQAVRRSTIA